MSPRPRAAWRMSFARLVFALLVLTQLGLQVQIAAAAPLHPALRDVAPSGLIVGSGISWEFLQGDPQYRITLRTEYNSITPENDMKWNHLHKAPTEYDFFKSDGLVTYAQNHGMAVHGHALIHNSQLPRWLTAPATPWTDTALIDVMEDHITTVMSHFAGKVDSWDVVNEAASAHLDPNVNSIWEDVIGYPRYVKLAFQFAHAADPSADLYYNDYAADGINDTYADEVHDLASDIQTASPGSIDGVGMQLHTSLCPPVGQFCPAGRSDVEDQMDRIAGLGLDIRVSEMDVRVSLTDPTVLASYQSQAMADQAALYADMLQACLGQSRCVGFTTWGFTDRQSWINATYPGYGAALPFDLAIYPKPAYWAICYHLRGTPC